MRIDLKWSKFNSERMELLIWQRWFCHVNSLCIAEAIHWSQPSHSRTIDILKIWSQCLLFVLETSSVTKRLQCLCCQPTIYHRFVDILMRIRDMTCFDCLYLKKSRSACSVLGIWVRLLMFYLGQTKHLSARGGGALCAPHRADISFIWSRAT